MRMTCTGKHQRGLGLVELMVGITIGLIVAAGASMVAVNQINEHRRLMLETQLQQDLRTAADLLQQDLRRAGFRGNGENSVWSPPAAVGSLDEKPARLASASPYAQFTSTDTDDIRSLSYSYARALGGGLYTNGSTPQDNEYFGFKWDKGTHVLYIQLGRTAGQPNWQPITDPDVVTITDFKIDVNTQSTDMGGFCDKPCNPAAAGAAAPVCPTLDVREVSFTITAQASKDANVRRTLSGAERVHADAVTGACPS